MPERFKYHETQEQELREYLGKDVSILRVMRFGIRHRTTLRELRQKWEAEVETPGCME